MFLSNDKNQKAEEIQHIISGEMIKLDKEQLLELAIEAQKAYAYIGRIVAGIMDIHLALQVKRLRVVRKCSWREVATDVFNTYHVMTGKELWYPASNQLAGMQLCDQAGILLNETID